MEEGRRREKQAGRLAGWQGGRHRENLNCILLASSLLDSFSNPLDEKARSPSPLISPPMSSIGFEEVTRSMQIRFSHRQGGRKRSDGTRESKREEFHQLGKGSKKPGIQGNKEDWDKSESGRLGCKGRRKTGIQGKQEDRDTRRWKKGKVGRRRERQAGWERKRERQERREDLRPDSFPPPVEGDLLFRLYMRRPGLRDNSRSQPIRWRSELRSN